MATIEDVLAPTVGSVPNSVETIQSRVSANKVSWMGPLAVVVGRSVFEILAQAVVAAIFLLNHAPTPWGASVSWWTIYGTLVDMGCLTLLIYFCSREGIRLRDLFGKIKLRHGYDVFLGAGYFLLVFPFFAAGAFVASNVVYGSTHPYLYPGSLTERVLPLWAVIYSISLWWIIWSPTEELTYQGYVLPRLRALSGNWLTAIVITSFWWALQHSFFPLIPGWDYILWRFLAFLPGCVVFTLLYARTRRLAPLIIAHWGMDLTAAIITLKF